MSNSITLNGFITLTKYDWSEELYYNFIKCEVDPSESLSEGTVVLIPHSLSFTLPADLNLPALRLKKLLAEKEKVRADFAKRLAEIEDSINKLTCLENSV